MGEERQEDQKTRQVAPRNSLANQPTAYLNGGAPDSMTTCLKNEGDGGWGDGSVVNSTYQSCIGPEFSSQNPYD